MNDHHKKLMANNYAMQQPSADSRLLSAQQTTDENDFFVSAQWLHHAIEHKVENLIVIDVTRGKGNYRLDQTRTAMDYELGHIPTAIHLNTDELGEFKDYFKRPEAMRDVFLSKGITCDSLLVFYSIYARDIMYIASRMAFAAYYLGVDQVKILDGGIQAWQRAGFLLEEGSRNVQPVKEFGCSVPKRPEIYVQTPDDLLAYRQKYPDHVLASVRTWKEFIGDNEGHAWNKGAGEIAGAVYMGDELLVNIDGELANPSNYLDRWKEWGIVPGKRILLYCGTSWRSSTAFFILKHLGWEKISMFDGSWYKWYLAHEENPKKYPIQRGNPLGDPPLEIFDGDC
ncbi:sulfurtransferase [Facklamia sp. DSM 111018]|uniref:thiosulfate sulfurtransferase n=1 Tax=Facklamia lactis TaxID=2749967 RepID=A0ABS0LSR6_9LACT|nr:rhodanese-like domain-containing protein [Facklamia lactis]MBG9981252.1 sulfurtransferase [Facklamia lactis]MBG9987054.1 sulfurtransferase [Facklamia lactis]